MLNMVYIKVKKDKLWQRKIEQENKVLLNKIAILEEDLDL